MEKEDFIKLLSKKLTDGLSDAEQIDFDLYLAEHQTYAAVADRLEKYYNRVTNINKPNPVGLAAIWERIHGVGTGSTLVKPRKSQDRSKVLKIAAAVLLFALSTTVLYSYFFDKGGNLFKNVLQTAAHEKLLFSLQDGSQIILAPNSSLASHRDFAKSNRELSLQGTAFFEVAKNEELPMDIQVGEWKVRVVGTSFLIKPSTKKDEAELILYTGKVQLYRSNRPEKVFLVRPNERVILGNLTETDTLKIERLNQKFLQTEMMKLQDSIAFKNQRFADLQGMIERKYNVRLVFENKVIRDKRFSGTLKEMKLEELFKVLKLSYPFDYQIKNNIVTIR